MSLRTLLLEDDDATAESLRDALEDLGHTVKHVADGLAAARAAAAGRFDLALLDVDVPVLSGLGVERLLSDVGDTAVIVMSGRMREHRRCALAAGAVACLAKPFDLNALLELVRAVEASRLQAPPWQGDVCRLGPEDLRRIAQLSDPELDELPFGLIRLDREGRVTAYNAFEARAARRDQRRVVGMRFVDLAPCVMVRRFVDAASRAWEEGRCDEVLRFVFPHHGADCVVSVRLYCEHVGSQLWLLVSKARRDPTRALDCGYERE